MRAARSGIGIVLRDKKTYVLVQYAATRILTIHGVRMEGIALFLRR